MDEKRIVITGANGQLGRALQIVFPGAIALDKDALDITDENAVNSYDWSNVSIIINTAAWTDVDGAEDPENYNAVKAVNVDAVRYLAKTATANNITLVHISSDYVFDGTLTTHTESEPFSPINVYGKTKAEGDTIVASTPKYYIIRTSWVIGDGKNFISIMKNLAERNIKPSVVDDQIGRLTFTDTLAESIKYLLDINAPFGTYNITNEGESVSWADIAALVFEKCGKPSTDVTRVSTAEYFSEKPNSAPRPLQSTLDLSKIEALGFTPENWRDKVV